ncbi:MAG: hypothetical protein EAX89_08015 [Candidatus Lokiarchaeota archaeon]|nr:hypothetical protein [Candidatus Lokiarchaeota archaeon]
MRNYNIAIIVVVVLLGGAGLGFVITGFATAGVIEYDYNISYDPSSPNPIEDLKINADIGKIFVQYNSSATSHYASIDVSIKVSGLFMAGKSYTDFFKASSDWWDESTKTFTLEVLPEVWFDPSHWFSSYNINITVTLRTDVVYDLLASSSTGSIEMYVPENVVLNRTLLYSSTGSVSMEATNVTFDGQVSLDTSTGSVSMDATNGIFNGLVSMTTSTGSSSIFATGTDFMEGYYAKTSTGSLTLNFTSCLMGDNIDGLVSTGSIAYRSYNMVYTKNLNLNLETSTGGINAYVYQYNNMNANVTSHLETSTGSIGVLYRDTLANTGVRFLSSTSTGSIDYTSDSTMEILGDLYQSLNYGTATQKYNFSLTTSTGNVAVDGESAQV